MRMTHRPSEWEGSRVDREHEFGMSQTEIGEGYGCGQSNIGQIERRALQKLRAAIEADAAACGLTVAQWLAGEDAA